MDGISQRTPSSTLNPNAPMFVPSAYRAVEDFSDEWCALVKSSPCFRDYWLQDPKNDPHFPDIDDPVLTDDIVEYYVDQHEEEERNNSKDLVVNVKVIPRKIKPR